MARSVRLDPLTGLPTTRIVSSTNPPRIPAPSGPGFPSPLRLSDIGSTPSAAVGPRSAPQIPFTEFGQDAAGGYANSSAPQMPGYPGVRTPTVGPGPTAAGSSSTGAGISGTSTPGKGPPDYATMIANDPGLQALRAELAAGDISADEFRRQAIRRAVVAYGAAPDPSALDPNTAGFLSTDLDPATRALAQKNTAEGLSTVAQEDLAHRTAVNGLQDALAARGMLQTGGLGVGLAQEDRKSVV